MHKPELSSAIQHFIHTQLHSLSAQKQEKLLVLFREEKWTFCSHVLKYLYERQWAVWLRCISDNLRLAFTLESNIAGYIIHIYFSS